MAEQVEKLQIAGPSGALEAMLAIPETDTAGVAVVCHPHPQYDGTMHNKVVHTLARASLEAGYATLRFNFRGVGASEGHYDAGQGETQDALAVADWGLQHLQQSRLLLLGFSFGSAVALRAAARRETQGLVSVALPMGYFQDAVPLPNSPWLAIHGDADEVVDTPAAVHRLSNLSAPPTVEIMPGAGHFFHGRLTQLRTHVMTFLAQLDDPAG